jgi:hypothetical protein
MLTGIHFILSYTCNFECDHCFLYCSPWSKGTFTLKQVTQVLEEAKKTGTVEWIFFEGGEPFLFYPLMVEGIRRTREFGLKAGVVTNAYGAITEEDAELWLGPVAEAGISYLSISNDTFHYGEEEDNPATIASRVAARLGIDTSPICIEAPRLEDQVVDGEEKGRPVIGGGAKFRGRAVEKLSKDLPRRPWDELIECPYEDLVSPSRVHIDSYGNVMACQGLSIGNMWQTPLSRLMAEYKAEAHPICGPLVRGGPAQLVRELGLNPETGYVDECHLCYLGRRSIIEKFPEYLAPRQVYGLDES